MFIRIKFIVQILSYFIEFLDVYHADVSKSKLLKSALHNPTTSNTWW